MEEKAKQLEHWQKLWPDQCQRIDRSLPIWEAAVLLPLRYGPEGWEILFEVRASDMGWQPGDICFPGGHREDGDASLEETARRETEEELGIAPEQIRVLGPLEYFYAPMGPVIYPFAGILSYDGPLSVDRSEVAEVFSVPLEALRGEKPLVASTAVGTQREGLFPLPGAASPDGSWRKLFSYDIYFYPYQGRMIWGITARILYNFLKRLEAHGF